MPIFSTENQAVLTGLLAQVLRDAGIDAQLEMNDRGEFCPGIMIKLPLGEHLGRDEFAHVLVEIV